MDFHEELITALNVMKRWQLRLCVFEWLQLTSYRASSSTGTASC